MRKYFKVTNLEDNTYTLHPDSHGQIVRAMRVKVISSANEKYGYTKNAVILTAALAYWRMNRKEVEGMVSADQFDEALLGFLDTHNVEVTKVYDEDGNALTGKEEPAKKVELDPLP